MGDQQYQSLIRRVRQDKDSRFAEAAYYFLLDALDFTMFRLGRNSMEGEARHVTVEELVAGIRGFAKEEFGPLAPYVFRSWGVTATEDFGHIVFEMCDAGLLNRRENDRLKDFQDGFDFHQGFDEIESLRI